MRVDETAFFDVVLDLEIFLNERFLNNVSSDLLERDSQLVGRDYFALNEMRNKSMSSKDFFYFPSVESSCFLVDENGVSERRMVNFGKVKRFSDYVVRKYEA